MSRFGKCQNFSGCLLAYRGEETELDDDQPFICAECGKALVEVKSPTAMWLRYILGVIGVAIVGVAVIFAVPSLRSKIFKPKKADLLEEKAKEDARTQEAANDSTAAPVAVDTAPSTAPEPPPTVTAVTAPQQINMDLGTQENKAVKAEVLTRVDLMPKVSSSNKDKLYGAVERARSMGKILTIPFGSSKVELTASDLEALKSELSKPGLAKLREDPTAVFVILGYADPKGDPKKNIAISQQRADVVLKAMRDDAGVINVMHTVAMGGSKLLDAQNLEKNRIVEVWAVLP